MKQKVADLEDEARKLIELQSQAELGSSSGSVGVNKEEADARSVYVGNVCYFVHSTSLLSLCRCIEYLLMFCIRLISAQHQRSSRPTFNHVVLLIVSLFCATNSLVILKGMLSFYKNKKKKNIQFLSAVRTILFIHNRQ